MASHHYPIPFLSITALFLLLLIIPTCSAKGFSAGPHIADVNILLPPRMLQRVEYRLQGGGGCFNWSWDHHDILSVIPEFNKSRHCSTSARLISIAPYSGRQETAVYASDVLTGAVLRCKVFIDILSRIQIFHSSIKLDLGGLATLRVRAFDAEDNVFSSLVGLQFLWKLIPESNESPHHLLHVPLKDSPLSDCSDGLCGDLNIQIYLESIGVHSDLFVVKGVGIGREHVSVRLHEPKYLLSEDKIELTVAEAMSLEPPSPLFVLIGAIVNYRLKVIRENMPQVVELPSPFHRWAVLNSSIAKVDPKMGSTKAMRLGETNVIVEDTRITGHVQASSLRVVQPEYIYLYLVPLSEVGDPVTRGLSISSTAHWYVISGRQYIIDVKVCKSSGASKFQEIFITETDELQLNYDQSKNWKSYPVSKKSTIKYHGRNENSRMLDAASPGLGKLSVSLAYLGDDSELKQSLTVTQVVRVCDKVEFRMEQKATVSSRILLPWAPGVHQELQLKAVGGCAQASTDYEWVSSDVAAVTVSAAGVAQVKGPGKATIKVVSVFDALNFDELVVEAHAPSSLVMLPNLPVETIVGSYLLAAVAMKASNGDYFYKCDAFSSYVRWKTGSESFVIVNATKKASLMNKVKHDDLWISAIGPSCSQTHIYAAEPGRTIVHATFSKEHTKFDHLFSGPVVLKAFCLIASFIPLAVRQAGDGNQYGGYWVGLNKAGSPSEVGKLEDLYLVPGTHIDIKLEGGPEKWGEGVEFSESVNVLDDGKLISNEGTFVHQIPPNSRNLYRITCHAVGNFMLVFKRGNLAGADHLVPVVEEVQLSLICAFPSSVLVLADEPVNAIDVIKDALQADRTSDHIRSMPITVANGRTIRVSAVSLSSSGKAFANSSSLSVKWELSKCIELAVWDDAYNMKAINSLWERFLVLKNASGLCTVRAMVHDFQAGSKNVLTDAVHLQLVSTLRVAPDYNLLLHHPDAKIHLSVTGGSCFLDAAVNDSQVVEVIQPSPGVCSQLTLTPKAVGTAVVTVYDIGLSPPVTATSVVQVADVEWIKIISGDEISITRGGSQNIGLLAGINDVLTFESSQYVYMNILVHIENRIIDLMDVDTLLSPDYGYIKASNFTVYGRHIGVTTLYVSARHQSGLEVLSQAIKVEVYAPPILHPHDIFLVPGASYVLNLRGGPSFDITIEYNSVNDETAKIDQSSGQVLAISPGDTTVIATIYGGGKTAICRVYGRIRVGVPTSMELNVQSGQLAAGLDIPIYPLLSEGDLFSFYELCRNYQWSIENEEVLVFQEGRETSGEHNTSPPSSQKLTKSESVLDQIDTNFIRLLYGRSAGYSNVSLKFSCDFVSGAFSQSMSYESNVTIRVVSNPPLALGIPVTWILPPHYTTSSLLPSMSETYSKWVIKNAKTRVRYSILGHYSVTDEQRKSFISIDGSRIQTRDSNTLACIQADDYTTGRTEIACCVRVAEVSQIRIVKLFAFYIVDLAVGAELELMISYLDYLGNPFHEARDYIIAEADTNHGDIVVVGPTYSGNGSITIKALRYGKALVRVKMVSLYDDPSKSDYILVSVGAHIYPRNPLLHSGGAANFCIKGLGERVSGQWTSANRSIVTVGSLSGEARAVGEGVTTVIYKSANFTLQTTVTVLKGNFIYVGAPGGTLTNVPSPASGYNFTVKLSGNSESPRGNVEVPYVCKVEPPYAGYAEPWRDIGTGNTYCLFFPYSPEHLARALPVSKEMRQGISISIHASLEGFPDVSGYATAVFLCGFSALDIDKDLLQLNLTQLSNRSIITLVGNTDVGIHWRAQDLLLVSRIHGQDFGINGLVQYEIKAQGNKPFTDKILFILLANGQRLEVDVTYKPQGEVPPSSVRAFPPYLGPILIAAAIILTQLIIRMYSNGRRQSASPATAQPPPATPERRSPASASDRSPQTPQPFIDYVRRTIDETPYYRRNTRRENSQNTY